MSEKYYIATPIFYPNGRPHIGHAYNALAADSLARFHRLQGEEVFFLSGTDEHGRKMQQTAEQMGLAPQQLADKNSAIFKNMLQKFAISNDEFIRTTEARHHKACQALWEKMAAAGDIYLSRYAGWYSVRQEAYYDEKDTETGEDGLRREKELGSPVIWNEEESYFFRLSHYQDKLLKLYAENPAFIGPAERYNEIVSFVRSDLRDLSISRTSFDWGVPVPGDPKHIMYVWVDALTNYLTALGYPDEKSAAFRRFWPVNAHIIGKDIIRFHAVYWPAFLLSAGINLPQHVFAHGFLLNRGEKMSKSVGNIVDPFALVDKFGLDSVRYFFLREIPFGQDGVFDDTAIINRINADLANDLGNLAQRSLSMIAKNCGSLVPEPGEFTAEDKALLACADTMPAEIKQAMADFAPHMALRRIFAIIAETNRYFAAQEPWKLRKTDEKRFATVLYVTAEIIRRAALLLLPFIPQSANVLLDMLAVPGDERLFKHITGRKLAAGAALPPPQPVFPRFVAAKEEGGHA
ncbi:MAG: methionine--tRNA ligase [Candidatus Tokpelaia sp.]|uniref:methionine--tRNA ligase n=1 Tax=Candidatus Tokpelaia sp. TaxID=2233777 RepID=UPI00123A896E|nr:methionine--tRNA ligase [Candidatus Tokpelaia sp.]KAA6204806.1 MAG: methionine--tRNA ligase [Candidatus Tokpelaia sp.]KAA6207618.1 MAG: methionine--tRNA ligase [Candidatus Tokpelaia sp.]KAA6404791.1 methionine--tRNA ligase [Candidatus Tokpelaia sp.]